MTSGDTPSRPDLPNRLPPPGSAAQPSPTQPPVAPGRWDAPGHANQSPPSVPPGGWSPPPSSGSAADWSSSYSPTPLEPQPLVGQETGAPRANRPARWKPIAAIATIIALVAVGVVVFVATRGAPSSAHNLPMNPQLQATYTAQRRPAIAFGRGEPLIEGSVDNLYILSPGDGSSSVSRYSNGDEVWTTTVRNEVPIAVYDLADGGPLVLTSIDQALNRTLTRLDLQTGDVMWTIDFEDGQLPQVIDGRLFVAGYGGTGLLFAGIEYDLATGAELRRVEDDVVEIEQDAIVTGNRLEGFVQRYNLNFEPIGERIPLIRDDYPNPVLAAATFDLNLVYYIDERLIVASPDGELAAECALDISSVSWLSVTDDGLIVADGFTELEVFALEDGVCRPIFKRDGYPTRAVVDDDYAVFDSFVGLTDRLSYEVVELATGETVATSEGQVLVADGYAITNVDGKATLSNLDDGTDIWTIEVPPESSIQLGDDMIAVVTPNGNDVTVEIYAGR